MLSSHRKTSIFTAVWLVGSLLVSGYFAFVLFPQIYSRRTSALVRLFFQTKAKGETTYLPNTPNWREAHLDQLSNSSYLYFDLCEAVPNSVRVACDSSANWYPIDLKDLGCNSIKGCNASTYHLSEEQISQYIAGLTTLPGRTVSLQDLPRPSLSDPVSWGSGAQWPIFFISLFAAIKLGRGIGEFLFTPYAK